MEEEEEQDEEEQQEEEQSWNDKIVPGEKVTRVDCIQDWDKKLKLYKSENIGKAITNDRYSLLEQGTEVL